MPTIEDLLNVIEEAQAAYDDANVYFDGHTDDPDALENLTKAATALQLAKAAYQKEQDARNGGSNLITLSGGQKESKTVQFAPGTPVSEMVRDAGWSTDRVSFARVQDGNLIPMTASEPLPAGSYTVLVQPDVRAG